MAHCWKDKLVWVRETYGTYSKEAIDYERSLCKDGDILKKKVHAGEMCMLPKGHNGPHVWTRTDRIGINFDQ